jgi:hypothetical protein
MNHFVETLLATSLPVPVKLLDTSETYQAVFDYLFNIHISQPATNTPPKNITKQ